MQPSETSQLKKNSSWSRPLRVQPLLSDVLVSTTVSGEPPQAYTMPSKREMLQKRLQNELLAMQKEPIPGVSVDVDNVGSDLTQWTVDMEGAKGTLYEGEKFQLTFKFSLKYPFQSPEVTFVEPNVPVHPHVFSNGHICLSILGDGWSPALTVQSVCLSIISMLSSCKKKSRPIENWLYVKLGNKNPKRAAMGCDDDSI
ncbi:ubiquitin-conjugating enzyme E2 W-like isoform X2 [Haemaphysalis longicornis]